MVQRDVTDIVKHDGRTVLGTFVAEGDVIDVQAFDVAGIESVSRRPTGKLRLGVVGALLALVLVNQVLGTTTLEEQADIRQPHVADGLVLHSRHDNRAERVAVGGNNI